MSTVRKPLSPTATKITKASERPLPEAGKVAGGVLRRLPKLRSVVRRGPGHCSGANCSCFAAGTLVWTPIGAVPIETVEVGDLLLSRDDATGEYSWQPVERVFVTADRAVLDLTLTWPGGGETLRVTAEHPVWVEGEGWVEAGYLRNGDKVARADAGGWATVQSLRGPPGKETVYNFVVATTHTFFVGSGATWVHNGGPCNDLVTVYRGTATASELDAYEETGHLLTDAARTGYLERGSLLEAYRHAETIHSKWIRIWGSEQTFAEAHGVFGRELDRAFLLDRTLLSVTTDPAVATYFATSTGRTGRVFQATLSRSLLIQQTFAGSTEKEFLIRFGSGGFRGFR